MQVYSNNQIDEIAFELKNAKAVILPTDTVWGVVSLSEKNIYSIKHRPSEKKIITFINKINYLNLPKYIEMEIEKYWPGGLTIIWKGKGYRIPKNPLLLALMDRVGPLFSSSANISGQDPISSIEQAKEVFKDQEFNLVLVEQKGFQISSTPSTIIDLDNFRVVRSGLIDGQKILERILKRKDDKTWN